MKKIIYMRLDGSLSVMNPVEGARLANYVTFEGERYAFAPDKLYPVDKIFRNWPVAGAVADWAETEDEFVARIMAKDVPVNAINARVVDEIDIPTDRTFRNAWEDNVGVKVNMPKAREIHREHLRALRRPLFEQNDLVLRDALLDGDTIKQAEAITTRDALRDVTDDPGIQAAQTPEALKAAVPAILTAKLV
ncbi:MAG: hypothetical protein U1E51_36325 [Candidatus Binatia bacterium]|nr:hypothetical protein [Candidatus Binatia bacterium]